MELNPDTLNSMRTSYSLKFQNAFDNTPTVYEKFCMIDGDPNHSAIEFPFLETFAFMREWIGPRQVKNLKSQSIRLVERAFEDTVKIRVRDIETDNWQQYSALIAQMGQAGRQLWDRLAVEALTGNSKWIDGKAFFHQEHKYGSSVICNTASDALSRETFETAYERMTSYTSHNGETLAVCPDVLMVGPKLRATAWDIIKNTKIVSGDNGAVIDNRNFDLVEIVVNPRLSGAFADDWYLMQTNGILKPVILQKSKDCELTALDRQDNENVFEYDEIIYGTKAYGNAACAFPHLVFRGGR
ncbi:MAG: Mu-like prophage major head subunit gpT family protein [Lentisphaeria bacterium]|nr:Mu-like prophage major head subunit gpT family protein [Lentisphaeria bacterium]